MRSDDPGDSLRGAAAFPSEKWPSALGSLSGAASPVWDGRAPAPVMPAMPSRRRAVR